MIFLMVQNQANRHDRISGENLFVVLLIVAPPSQELEPPTIPARFTIYPVMDLRTARIRA